MTTANQPEDGFTPEWVPVDDLSDDERFSISHGPINGEATEGLPGEDGERVDIGAWLKRRGWGQHNKQADGISTEDATATGGQEQRPARRGLPRRQLFGLTGTAAVLLAGAGAMAEIQENRSLSADLDNLRSDRRAEQTRQAEQRTQRAIRFMESFRVLDSLAYESADPITVSEGEKAELRQVAGSILVSNTQHDPLAAYVYALQRRRITPDTALQPEDYAVAFALAYEEPLQPKESERDLLDGMRLADAFLQQLSVYATGTGRALGFSDQLFQATEMYTGSTRAALDDISRGLMRTSTSAANNDANARALAIIPMDAMLKLQELQSEITLRNH